MPGYEAQQLAEEHLCITSTQNTCTKSIEEQAWVTWVLERLSEADTEASQSYIAN